MESRISSSRLAAISSDRTSVTRLNALSITSSTGSKQSGRAGSDSGPVTSHLRGATGLRDDLSGGGPA